MSVVIVIGSHRARDRARCLVPDLGHGNYRTLDDPNDYYIVTPEQAEGLLKIPGVRQTKRVLPEQLHRRWSRE